MANVLQYLPDLSGDEMVFIQGIMKEMNDNQAQMFTTAYRGRRRDPMVILLTTLLGFVGIAGVQRFVLDQIGMGLLYLFTGGICFIGTIIDLVSYQRLAFEYNQRAAQQVSVMIRGIV